MKKILLIFGFIFPILGIGQTLDQLVTDSLPSNSNLKVRTFRNVLGTYADSIAKAHVNRDTISGKSGTTVTFYTNPSITGNTTAAGYVESESSVRAPIGRFDSIVNYSGGGGIGILIDTTAGQMMFFGGNIQFAESESDTIFLGADVYLTDGGLTTDAEESFNLGELEVTDGTIVLSTTTLESNTPGRLKFENDSIYVYLSNLTDFARILTVEDTALFGGGGGGDADSSIFATKYDIDTLLENAINLRTDDIKTGGEWWHDYRVHLGDSSSSATGTGIANFYGSIYNSIVDSEGKFGIGTMSPDSMLEVNGGGNFTQGLKVGNSIQVGASATPTAGAMAYNSSKLQYSNDGVSWSDVGSGDVSEANSDSAYYIRNNATWSDINEKKYGLMDGVELYLTRWYNAFNNAYHLNTDKAKIAFLGDSYTQLYAKFIKKNIVEQYGYGGGYRNFAVSAGWTSVYDYIIATPGWTDGGGANAENINPHNRYYEGTAGDSLLISAPAFSRIIINYKQVSGGGSFSVRLGDNGTKSTQSVDAGTTASMWYEKDFGALYGGTLTAPTDTIILKVESGTVRLYGYKLSNDYDLWNYGKTIEISTIHNGGATTTQFWDSKTETDYQRFMDTIAPDLLCLTFKETLDELYGLDSLISLFQYLRPEMDILLITPHDVAGYDNTQEWYFYEAIANKYDIGIFNSYNYVGTEDRLDSLSLLDVAKVHLSTDNGIIMPFRALSKLLFNPTYKFYRNYAHEIITDKIQFDSLIINPDNNNNNVILGRDAGTNLAYGTSQTIVGAFSGINAGLGNTSLGKSSARYQSGSYTTAIGSGALFGVDGSSTGNGNTAIGYYALSANTTGVYNTAIGTNVLNDNTTGNYNTVVGADAANGGINTDFNCGLGSNVFGGSYSGEKSVAIGYLALLNAGSNNVGIGYQSLTNAGSANTAVGYRAGNGSTGTGNVYIGNDAGRNSTGNYKLYMDVSSTSSPLIYGEFDNDRLQINGSLEINQTGTPSTPQNDMIYFLNENNADADTIAVYNGTAWKYFISE